jgi:hypothetical protein
MARRFAVAAIVGLALVLPASARADVGVYPTTRVVPLGGVIRGWGDDSRMAVYLVPAKLGPKRHPCHGNGICEPTVRGAPSAPFTLLGRLRRTASPYSRQSFSFPVPTSLRPGLYRMYLYCRPCGGSLIQSGGRLKGETIRLTARPRRRDLAVTAGPVRKRFLMSEPAGVILLLRLTVPHGTPAVGSGTIPRLAGVRVSSGTNSCRRRGSVDVCTQAEEWCPMPATAWHFALRRSLGQRA